MMRRKFSFDVGSLKIAPSRDLSSHQRDLTVLLGSPPPTPKSVRPPLPDDTDAELRAACTYIVSHPKPSHENWNALLPSQSKPSREKRNALSSSHSKPSHDALLSSQSTLATDAVKGAGEESSAPPIRKSSLRSRNVPQRQGTSVEPSKYSYKPTVPVKDLFSQEGPMIPLAGFLTRDVQSKTSGPARRVEAGARAETNAQDQSRSQHHQLAVAKKAESPERTRASAGSKSLGTTESSPQTDSTDCHWSTSTALTSAVITPALSGRTSSQTAPSTSGAGGWSAPKVEAVNAERMTLEQAKHENTIENKRRHRAMTAEDVRIGGFSTMPTCVTAQSASAPVHAPAREPISSVSESGLVKDVPRPATSSGMRQDARNDGKKHAQSASWSTSGTDRAGAGGTAWNPETRDRLPIRSSSRLGRPPRTAGKAAGRAGSVTDDILGHYMRPDLSPMIPEETQNHSRSDSPTRSTSERPREAPCAADRTASGKPSVDITRGHARTGSSDSLLSTCSGVRAAEHSSRWRPLRPWPKSQENTANASISRSDRANPAYRGNDAKDQCQSPSQGDFPAKALNRDLPPLPGLDRRQPAEEQGNHRVFEPTGAAAPVNTTYKGMRRVFSMRTMPQQSNEDTAPTRAAPPTSPRPQMQAVDVKISEQLFLNTNTRPSQPLALSRMVGSNSGDKWRASVSSSEGASPKEVEAARNCLEGRSIQTSRPEPLAMRRRRIRVLQASRSQAV